MCYSLYVKVWSELHFFITLHLASKPDKKLAFNQATISAQLHTVIIRIVHIIQFNARNLILVIYHESNST